MISADTRNITEMETYIRLRTHTSTCKWLSLGKADILTPIHSIFPLFSSFPLLMSPPPHHPPIIIFLFLILLLSSACLILHSSLSRAAYFSQVGADSHSEGVQSQNQFDRIFFRSLPRIPFGFGVRRVDRRFLVATKRLYTSVCPSVGPSIRHSVGR